MEAIKDTITVTINGREVAARPGQTILEVVEEHGLDRIPTLCHSPELEPYASCFLCTVEVEGRPNLQPSCATRVAPGMKVITKSDRITASRRTALELLVSNHYADCLSPCLLGCPAGVNTQGYLSLAAMGQYRKALDIVRETNPLPAICGRVCVRKCEMVCRRTDLDEPVGINFVKRFLSDIPEAYLGGPERDPRRGKSVGIVGSGPAGLTAAWFLGRKGYDTVIYEALAKPGGMLRYGIPEYRLPKDVIDREIEYIARVGARIECNTRIGRDIAFDELRKKYDAVFIAAGAMGGKEMGVPGENETDGIVRGVDFLYEMTEDPSPVKGTIVVVGGGNTATDVARTAWRLGAGHVILLYRRTKAEMPADKLEIEDCLKEGIEIMELAAPVAIVADEVPGDRPRLKALKCIRMKLGEPDSSGRRRPVPQAGSEFELPCDIAVSAIGQEPVIKDLVGDSDGAIGLTKWGTIVSDGRTMKTNVDGVFAGGDVADDGPTVVIDAIRDGQRAAKAIHNYLSGEPLPEEPFVVTKQFWAKPGRAELGDIPDTRRREMPEISVEERDGTFDEVATGYDEDDAFHECQRCLMCGCVVFDHCKLRLYSQEYGVDMNRFKGNVRKHKVDDRHPFIFYDPNKCILCARCVRTCERVLPISALGLINRGFRTEMRPAMDDPLVETNCVACGNCIDTCPTGSLTVKFPFLGRASLATEDVASHCGFCSIGCEIKVRKFSDDRYFVTPSGKPGDYLCIYGRFGAELFIKRRRLAEPTKRIGGRREAVSFPAALDEAASGLLDALERHGPGSLAVFVSPEATNEVMYLAAKLARECLGTNNVSSIATLLAAGRAGALDESLGFTASTADRGAISRADVIVCNNTDTENDHLIISAEIIEAVKNGAKLIVANSARDPLEVLAAIVLDPLRGRSAVLWNGVIQALIDMGKFDRATIFALPGGEEFLGDLFDYSSKAISDATGVGELKIFDAAKLISTARRVVFLHSPDRPQDQAAGDAVSLANFAILLRAAGIEADLILPHVAANGAGMEVCGASPAFLPGKLPATNLPGARTNEELLSLLSEGRIKAALIIGEDPMRNDRTASFFRNVEFLAAIDWTVTETTEFAGIAFPGATYLECEGTRVNFEGEVQRYEAAIRTPSDVPVWQILCGIGERLGVKSPYGSAADITGEIRAKIKAGANGQSQFHWNENGKRLWDGSGRLMVAAVETKPVPIPPALTAGSQYKRDIREIGVGRYRVKSK